VGWILLGLLLLFIGLLVLYFRAKAGVIIAIKALLDKQDTSFRKAFSVSKLFYLRLFGASFLVWLVQVLSILIAITPFAYLIYQGFYWRASVLGILSLGFLLPVIIVAQLTNLLAPMSIVFHDLKIKESIKFSFNLISKHWPQLILLSLFLLGVAFAALFTALLAAAILASPFVLLAFMAYHRMETATLILTVLASIIGLVGYIAVQSATAVFIQAVWVLAFRELVKPEKLEEEKVAIVPETAS
jgi:hypothetical protein